MVSDTSTPWEQSAKKLFRVSGNLSISPHLFNSITCLYQHETDVYLYCNVLLKMPYFLLFSVFQLWLLGNLSISFYIPLT